MGIGDSIRKAADNAMKDLGGTSEPTDDAHVPKPGDPAEEIKVHSSISEGSNAADAAEDGTGGQAGEAGPGGARGQGQGADTGTTGTATNIVPGRGGPGGGPGGPGPAGAAEAGTAESGPAESGEDTAEPPRDVPGPGGLPDPDPDVLRADPSEGDTDPSTGMGRG